MKNTNKTCKFSEAKLNVITGLLLFCHVANYIKGSFLDAANIIYENKTNKERKEMI